MRTRVVSISLTLGAGVIVTVALLVGCGSQGRQASVFDAGTAVDGSVGPTQTLPDGAVVPTDGYVPQIPHADSGPPPPPAHVGDGGCQGFQCEVQPCGGDAAATQITGRVLDPAGNNALYNILAFVPLFDPASDASTIQAIEGGVTFPSGVTCDSCSYLYTGDPVALGTTGTNGVFTIPSAPAGSNIPLVVQVGKWRTHITVPSVTACETTDAGDILLPSAGDPTDSVISLPQVAISLGTADSLECLLPRMGIASTEFVVGAGGTGHFHLYMGGTGGSGFPTSSASLWDSIGDMDQYDVTMFSCEGHETTNADPAMLENYVNHGGRAFASHFHYSWLSGSIKASGTSYTANADWGDNLATWQYASDNQSEGIDGGIVTTLNSPAGGVFQKGLDFQAWLGDVGALTSYGDLPIEGPAYNANVTTADTKVQPWITDLSSDNGGFPTAYLSFDAPIDAVAPSDGGSPPYCGRVVFADLHVGDAEKGDKKATNPGIAGNCTVGQLSPQEKALEFMLFDLSACVTPDQAPPQPPVQTYDAGPPPQ